MWAQIVAVALGISLMASPAVLDYGEPASTVSWTLGPIAASIAFIAAFAVGRPLRWLNVPLGGSLAIAPWLLDYPTAALVDAIVVGLALVVLSLVTRPSKDEYGGGWASLFR